MSTSYSQPDTIYLSVALDWHPEVLVSLKNLCREVVNRRQGSLGRFVRLMNEAEDKEAHETLRRMTVLEAQEYLSETEQESVEFEKVGTHLGDQDWECYGWSPRKGCPLTFENRKFRLHVMPKNCRKTPNLYIELGQISLWSHNWRELLIEANALIHVLGADPEIKLSRLDIATHTQSLDTNDLLHENFKTRLTQNSEWKTNNIKIKMQDLMTGIEIETDSEKRSILHAEMHNLIKDIGDSDRTIYRSGFATQTISFGRRGSSNPYVRMYVKSREIAYSPTKKKLFRDVWDQLGFDYRNKNVLNIEFEMVRACLVNKRFSIFKHNKEHIFSMETIEDMLLNFDNLLLYLMGPKGCIQMIKQNSDDTNRSRWPDDPRWIALVDGLEDVSKTKIKIERSPFRRDERMDKTMLSYMVNYWAAKCEDDGQDVPLTDELIRHIQKEMTDSCLKEIEAMAKSGYYRDYVRNKLHREVRKRGLDRWSAGRM